MEYYYCCNVTSGDGTIDRSSGQKQHNGKREPTASNIIIIITGYKTRLMEELWGKGILGKWRVMLTTLAGLAAVQLVPKRVIASPPRYSSRNK